MTMLTRRIITISFVAAFFILAPITLLYTTGFRYNWQKKKVNEVGVLGIKTYPANAEIYLNNELQKNTSPLYLNDLAPNTYSVRVALQDYFPWTKNLEVHNRTSTLAYDITLFKQSKPQLLVDGNINAYAFDRTGEHLAVVRNAQTIEIFSAEGEKQDTLYIASEKNLQQVNISWSVNNSYILVENLALPGSSFVIPTDKKRPLQTTARLAGALLVHPRLDNSDNETLYGITGRQLLKISLRSLDISTLQKTVQSFEMTPLGVIALNQTTEGIEVLHFTNHLILRPAEKLSTLPQGAYTILPGSIQGIIAIANTITNKILLLDTKDTSHPLVEINAKNGTFGGGAKNEVFLSVGEDEVNVFDFTKGQSTLLGRYGKAPSAAFPLYNTPYYLLYINGELLITELDDRDKRNTIKLVSDPSISNISMDRLSAKIFYTSPAGLSVLEMQ